MWALPATRCAISLKNGTTSSVRIPGGVQRECAVVGGVVHWERAVVGGASLRALASKYWTPSHASANTPAHPVHRLVPPGGQFAFRSQSALEERYGRRTVYARALPNSLSVVGIACTRPLVYALRGCISAVQNARAFIPTTATAAR